MTELSLQDRCNLYRDRFPRFPAPAVVNDARIEALWIMGNDYRVKSGYYGGYPAGYLDRIMSMFPDFENGLHLFSGMIDEGREQDALGRKMTTFDINPDRPANIHGDAEKLSEHFAPETFDLILADPPYSAEDAEHYGTPMVSRNKVLKECHKVMKPGGWLIWLDQVFPQFRKEEFNLALSIGMIKSTNHRVRAIFGFQKREVER